MTREEIIARLEGMKGNGYKEQEQAIDGAIKALKVQPCEIIRCKNCDEWREYEEFFGDEKYCCVHHCNTGEDYFCGDAVKRG